MEIDRFHDIVSAYGANPDRWPIAERESALALLRESARQNPDPVTALLEAARQQDSQLDQLGSFADEAIPDPLTLDRLTMSIINATQPTLAERLITWLLPDPSKLAQQFWRPALAASLPLVLGIGIGMNTLAEDTATLTASEELSVLAITGVPGLQTGTGQSWSSETGDEGGQYEQQ